MKEGLSKNLQRPLMEHGPECWKWGHHHYHCAVKKIEELLDDEQGLLCKAAQHPATLKDGLCHCTTPCYSTQEIYE